MLKTKIYLHEENVLLLYDALCAPGVLCSLVFFIFEISCLLNFHLDVSDIVYNDNFFGHAAFKGVFDVLDEIECLPSLSHF